MRQAFVFESFEARSHLSATAHPAAAKATAYPTTGVSAGNRPAAVLPEFTGLFGSAHDSNKDPIRPDPSNGLDLDTSLKITFQSNGNGAIDNDHLYRAAFRITDLTTGTVLVSSGTNADLSKVITSGGGDVLVVSFKNPLEANHSYKVEINGSYATGTNGNGTTFDNRVRTGSGGSYVYFDPQEFTFTTGTFIASPSPDFTSAFSTAVDAGAGNKSFTCVTQGPDGKLYASDTKGYIYRYVINADGSLTLDKTITTVRDNNGGSRLVTGIAFSPKLTAADVPLMYVSHGAYQFGTNGAEGTGVANYAQNFSGKISTLYGANLDVYQDYVVNMPRSAKDHTNNQLTIDPKGQNLYFGLAAMNAMGRADAVWGNRPENIYTATILRLRLGLGSTNGKGQMGINGWLRDNSAIDLKIDGTNANATGLVAGTLHYNIYNGRNPLRIWADGIRNAYDVLFHSNGHMYSGINGSSAGGNTPATPSDLSTVPNNNRLDSGASRTSAGRPYTAPTAPQLTNVAIVEQDVLLDVKENAYYGHPNPTRGEYVLAGGNPTGDPDDPYLIRGNGTNGYLPGQQPDRNYVRPTYAFGQNYSPNGLIEYQSVGGKNTDLNNYILIARYSSGGDIFALKPKADGGIEQVQARIQGLTGFDTPLDLAEDLNTGNLYVAVLTDETGNGATNGSIRLVKPITSSSGTPNATIDRGKLGIYTTPGNSGTETVTIRNTGSGALIYDQPKTKIGGSGRKAFELVNAPTSPYTIAPGKSLTLTVRGTYPSNGSGNIGATLYLYTNDPDTDHFSVQLRVFGTGPANLQAGAASVKSVAKSVVRPAPADVFASTRLIEDLDLS